MEDGDEALAYYGYDDTSVTPNAIGRPTSMVTSSYAGTQRITVGLIAIYDANGNMLTRWTPSSWFTQTWNIFNQITRTVSAVTPTLDVRYFYDADNQLIRKLIGGAHTIYIGNYYEKNLTTRLMTQYYYLGGQRIAMRVGTMVTSTVTFLHGDHLGSASAETNDSYGVKLAEMRYSPWGETYYQSAALSTDKQFTGQRQESGFGVYDYGARFYSPLFGMFISPDSIVPGAADPQNLNRYSYSRNNPLKYIDPSGHCTIAISIPLLGISTSISFLNGLCPGDKPSEVKCLDNCNQREIEATMVAGLENNAATATAEATSQPTMTPMPTDAIDNVSSPTGTPGTIGTPNPNIISAEDFIYLNEEQWALRQEYEDKVRNLKTVGERMLAQGMSEEQVARALSAERRALGMQYKEMTPPELLKEITERNIRTYNDPLGPTVEYDRTVRGKSWAQIIDSASKPGGKDIIRRKKDFE